MQKEVRLGRSITPNPPSPLLGSHWLIGIVTSRIIRISWKKSRDGRYIYLVPRLKSQMSQFGLKRRLAVVRTRRTRARRIGPYLRGRRVIANGQELKFHDIDLDDATISSNGAITDSINKIGQGVTESTRVGRKCVIRRIGWKFRVKEPETNGGTSAPPSDTVRVILYLDKQANGAAATVTGILESADFQSFNNLANTSRFNTLMDRVYTLNHQGGIGTAADQDWAEVVIDDSFYKTCNINIEFDSTAGAITEIRSNNLGVLLITEGGTAGFESKFRLRFSDS